MANLNETLKPLLELEGAMCASVVDSQSGMMLGSVGSGLDMSVASAGNTEVVRAKMHTMKMLGLSDSIEDILITLGTQYHIIRPVASKPGLFIYYVLDKTRANLALARHKCVATEKAVAV